MMDLFRRKSVTVLQAEAAGDHRLKRALGPVNLTGPAPVTNDEFTKTLGRVVRRPTVIPTPLIPLRARYGSELVQHLLVEGQRVLPKRLEATGYAFEHPTLEDALRAVVDRH